MKIIIESPHFTVSTHLNKYTTVKVQKLAHINDQLIRSDVFLRLDKSNTDDNKICEIKVFAPGHNFFARRQCLTFEDAVTQVIHALEKQLGKQKTKWEGSKKEMQIEDSEVMGLTS
jgi:putative sigma-54 modulation protein